MPAELDNLDRRILRASGDIDLVLEIAAGKTDEITALRDAIAAMPEVATTRTLVVMATRWSR
jgi:DNA-binding Lrp family transcriptional regulator